MARLWGAAVLAAVVLETFGCNGQGVGPESAANAPRCAAPQLRPGDVSRWRPAVEGYVPAVKLENTRPLEGARVSFARFLNQVHVRIHPLFADEFLAGLDGLRSSDPRNQVDLQVKLEIVLERDGGIHRMGVIASSGVTAFDVGALDSVDRAQPFGPPPTEVVSSDGFVYFHWEFHRGPEACGTWNARPFLLGARG